METNNNELKDQSFTKNDVLLNYEKNMKNINSNSTNLNDIKISNTYKLSTIIEDNEVIKNLLINRRKFSHEKLNFSFDDNHDKNKNNQKNYKKEISKESKKIKRLINENYEGKNLHIHSNNDNGILSKKINININNNININLNVNNYEDIINQSKNIERELNAEQMKIFMNKTMNNDRSSKIFLSSEDSKTSSDVDPDKCSKKSKNSYSNPEINNRKSGKLIMDKIKKEEILRKKLQENKKQEIAIENISITNSEFKKDINQKEIDIFKDTIKIKNDKMDEKNNHFDIQNNKNLTDCSVNDNNDLKNNLATNIPDIIKEIKSPNIKKECNSIIVENDPAPNRANFFANFFHRLNKTHIEGSSKNKEDITIKIDSSLKEKDTMDLTKKLNDIQNKEKYNCKNKENDDNVLEQKIDEKIDKSTDNILNINNESDSIKENNKFTDNKSLNNINNKEKIFSIEKDKNKKNDLNNEDLSKNLDSKNLKSSINKTQDIYPLNNHDYDQKRFKTDNIILSNTCFLINEEKKDLNDIFNKEYKFSTNITTKEINKQDQNKTDMEKIDVSNNVCFKTNIETNITENIYLTDISIKEKKVVEKNKDIKNNFSVNEINEEKNINILKEEKQSNNYEEVHKNKIS